MKIQCEACGKKVNKNKIVWDLEEDREVCADCYKERGKK